MGGVGMTSVHRFAFRRDHVPDRSACKYACQFITEGMYNLIRIRIAIFPFSFWLIKTC
jgi:hypothetical protein